MPIYEYRCNNCNRKSDIFARDFSNNTKPTCSHCGSKDMNRLFSRFAHRKSKNDKSVYDDILSDSKLTRGLMQNDPRALAEWSRKMSRAAGDDITPETNEILNRLDAGEDVSETVEDMKKAYFEEDTSPASVEE